MFQFELGQIVTDRITGLECEVIGRAEYTHNPNTYELMPTVKIDATGRPLNSHWRSVEAIDPGIIPAVEV